MEDAKSVVPLGSGGMDRSRAGARPAEASLEVNARRLDRSTPEEILQWAWAEYGPRVKLATSFGVEASVLVEAVARTVPEMPILTIDTGRLPEETHVFIETLRTRYGVTIEVRLPDHRAVEKLVREVGPRAFRRSVEQRHACCDVRKVDPLRRALAELRAWVSGIRREQTSARATARVVEWDTSGSLVKVNPLVHWSWRDVIERVRDRDLPAHPLLARGYASIGCVPCTRPTRPGEDARAGRWWWESCGSRECGLHT